MAKTIYPLVAGPIPTTLTHAYVDGDTTIDVVSVEYIPNAINHITIRDEEDSFVTLEYTGVSGTTLSGISYVEGDKTHTFPVGSSVCRCFDKYDYDALTENLEEKQDIHVGIDKAGEILLIDDNGDITTGEAPNSAVWGKITGDITDQFDLENEFVKEYQGESNVNRSLIVDESGYVVLGSLPTTPYVEDETAIFPNGSGPYVQDHTVIF